MNLTGAVVLLGWLPFVVLAFNAMPRAKAVSFLFVTAWLILPSSGFTVPGLPDYDKMTATVAGVLACALLFDGARLLAFRFRRVDLPIVVWCLGAFVTSLANGLGVYDALSALVEAMVRWGFPYLIGRLYLDDLQALRTFAVAVAIGGLVYVVPCLVEIRLSPFLSARVYGITHFEGTRYGGYRPRVFLSLGLELGMWMTSASLMSWMLWRSKSVASLWGLGFGKLVLALMATTVLCKSTGSTALLLLGIGGILAATLTRKNLAVWVLVALPPLYCVTRAFDLWSGMQVVELATATVGADRAGSFEYRLGMERILADHALQRPLLGWSRGTRWLILDRNGNLASVPDGFWVIALGTQGLAGLSSFVALFILPMIVTLRRFPVSRWKDPLVAPAVGLSMMVLLEMLDLLSNAMLMPIYPLAIGGILGARPRPVDAGEAGCEGEGEAGGAVALATGLLAEGRMAEAGAEFHRAIALASGEGPRAHALRAEALDGLGHALLAEGRPEEAIGAFGEALVLRDGLAAGSHAPGHFRDLAIARDGLSRALAESGRLEEAVEERRMALQLWEALAADSPGDPDLRDHLANCLNDLAWLMATDPAAPPGAPARAVELAEEAVRVAPGHDASWNTLGVARYRAGDWAGAIEALERSALAGPGGVGTAFDHYFLAMAWCRLRRQDHAGEWFERGEAWAARHRPGHPALGRFRAEAASLLRGGQGAGIGTTA